MVIKYVALYENIVSTSHGQNAKGKTEIWLLNYLRVDFWGILVLQNAICLNNGVLTTRVDTR